MARHREGDFESWVRAAAQLPWWLSLLLAAVVYVILHHFAGLRPTAPHDVRGFGPVIAAQIWIVGATFGQYLVPAVLCFGAILSLAKAERRERLYRDVQNRKDNAALFDMSWREFEQLVGEYFRRRGFAVVETGGGGADGGRDLVLRRGRDQYLVQCKQWRASRVGVAVVRELLGTVTAEGAAGGVVVTSGRFTDEATDFADGRGIELIDGAALKRSIGDVSAPPVRPKIAPVAEPVVPACPRCGSPMVRRVAKAGARAGESFWGCSRFPGCRGIRPGS